MKLFAVFLREVRAPSELQRLRRERWTAALIAAIALATLSILDRLGDLSFGRAMQGVALAGIAPALLLTIGLSRASTLFSVERREGTLPLLLLTHLTGFDIVLGKVLRALLTEASVFVTIIPMLVLPFCAAGLTTPEVGLALVGSLNVIFYGLALGIFASVWADGTKATAVCLLVFLPLMMYSSPVGFLFPRLGWRAAVSALDWANPLEPMSHIQTVAGGLRSGLFWSRLLSSHVVAWAWLALAGFALPRVCRWQQGRNLGARRRSRFRAKEKLEWQEPDRRAPLLNLNPVLWLCQRRRWPSVKIWFVLILTGASWGTLSWITWAGPGVNVTYLFAVAAATSWALTLLAGIPAEAAYQLVEDRQSGALELLLCTPTSEPRIIRGVWLDLRKRYLGPLVCVMAGAAALGVLGYLTSGFGGMLDEDVLPTWLFAWTTGIVLLPMMLVSLCWVAMRRALFAQNAGEASALAFLHLIILPAFGLGFVSGVLGEHIGLVGRATLFALFALSLILRARRARTALLAGLRSAAADRYSSDREVWPRFWRNWRRITGRECSNEVRCKLTAMAGGTSVPRQN
jgi:ABC-type transport system involved in multi-copper enzyme maturation permease subunit